MKPLQLILSDNFPALNDLERKSIDLIYIDPPYNTGREQRRGKLKYDDSFDDLPKYLNLRLLRARKLLKKTGSIFIHLDQREVHYVKVLCDTIFGRDNFQNEIIWAYDYGGRSKSKWPCKHDTILWYTRSSNYTWNYDAIDRIPYMAPGLAGREKATLGKTPTDVWWNTIVHTNGKEKTGYPTQKPLAILERIVKVHSNKGDVCLDFFAGSGSFGEAALKHKRKVILIDKNPQALKVMRKRLKKWSA